MNDPQNAAGDVGLAEKALEHFTKGEIEAALKLAVHLRETSADDVAHLYVLGLISVQMNRLTDAIECLKEGHRRAPEVREFSAALSFLYANVGNLADSVYHSKLTIAQQPHPLLSKFAPAEFSNPQSALQSTSLQGYYEDAFISYMSQDYERAHDFCRSELTLNPTRLDCVELYGHIAVARGLYHDAMRAFNAARALPGGDRPDVQAWQAQAQAGSGMFDDAVANGLEAIKRAPDDLDILGRIICALDPLPDVPYAIRAELVKCWREQLAALPVEPLSRGVCGDFYGRKLKVGYLINDYVLENFIDHLDVLMEAQGAAGLEVHAYQLFVNNPRALGRLRGKVTSWRELTDVDDETAAAVIHGERIDALIDMCGMSPGARPRIMAQRPAPLQVNWLAGEVTGGGIDYVVADPISRNALPAGTPVLELPLGVFCQPRPALMVSTAHALSAPALANGYVTFGASLDYARILPSIELWTRILDAVPNSRLLLGNRTGLEQETLAALDALFGEHGLSDRILLDLPEPGAGVSSFWGKIDVLLSAVSSPNVLEMAESLSMGVPVVARHGTRVAHARAVAVLNQAAQGHWVGDDDDHYLRIAASMARDVETVAVLRSDLLAAIGGMPLCDVTGFASSFELALTQALIEAPNS